MLFPEIKMVATQSELDAVCKFRYQVYIDELGDVYDDAYASNGMLKDELDEFGIILYAESDGKIIATGRANIGKDGKFSPYWTDCYDLDKFPDHNTLSLSSKMMVAPEWRSKGLTPLMLLEFLKIFRSAGVHFNFLDCIPSLVPLYEAFGFRRYKANAPEDKNFKYYVPMVFCMEDYVYLEKINCPLYSQIASYENDQGVADWFNKNFIPSFGTIKESLLSDDDLFNFFSEQIDVHSAEICQGLDQKQLLTILRSSTILNCKSGETICYKTDSDKSLYILINGKISVEEKDKGLLHMEINAGQIFGEINFIKRSRRAYDAVAISDVQILVIHGSFVKRAKTKHPQLIKKVLDNVNGIIKQRAPKYHLKL